MSIAKSRCSCESLKRKELIKALRYKMSIFANTHIIFSHTKYSINLENNFIAFNEIKHLRKNEGKSSRYIAYLG